MARGDYSVIPEPMMSMPSHQDTLVSLKEAVEVLTRQRRVGQIGTSAATVDELNAKIGDAPHDGYSYYRRMGGWVRVPPRIETVEYVYDTSHVEPPANQHITVNVATLTAVTKIWLDNETSGGADVMRFLRELKAGVEIYIQDIDVSTNHYGYRMTANAIDKGGYVELPVTYVNAAGGIANNARVSVTFIDELKV